jgi:uncharacterized protein (UPF0335 family)
MPAIPRQERAEAAAARSLQAADTTSSIGGIAGDRLKSFFERIERLEEEKRTLAGDIKELFSEAKGNGFDVKVMRKILAIRKMDRDDYDEQETMMDLYMKAIGMRAFLAASGVTE